MNRALRSTRLMLSVLVTAAACGAANAEFRQTVDVATVAFEGPSAKAARQYVYSRGTPLEVVVQIEGWFKVRDVQGEMVWVERKALGARTNVVVKTAVAEVYAAPDVASPIVFRAENGVTLQLVTPQTADAGAWAQVRHRDGQVGFMRLDTLFGF